jgi:hypothetical protein
MFEKYLHMAVLISVGLGIHLAHRFLHDRETPLRVIQENWAACKFAPPADFRKGPYASSIRWCPSYPNRQAVVILMNHLRVHGHQMDIACGCEFGSNVRVCYIHELSLMMLNPEIVYRSVDPIPFICWDNVGLEKPVRTSRSSEVELRFFNETFGENKFRFKNKHACSVQSMVDMM